MPAIVFKAVYIDAKSMRGVKAVRFTFDVPVEDSNEALEVLGGMPRPDEPVYVGITRLREGAQATVGEPPAAQLESPAHDRSASFPNEKERKRFDMLPMSQQAGIRCNDPAFWHFLNVEHSDCGTVMDAESSATIVRHLCGVTSRADLKSNTEAGVEWAKINRDFEVWMLG